MGRGHHGDPADPGEDLILEEEIAATKLSYAFINLIILSFLPLTAVHAAPISAQGTVEVYFSPKGGASDAIIKVVGAARDEILIQAYTLTAKNIIDALVQAKRRGVKIEIILDFEHAELEGSTVIFDNNGIPVFVDSEHMRNHSKIMIIDRNTIITGSYDFTKEAETEHSENLLVLKGNSALAGKFMEDYNKHRRHSQPYVRSSVK